MKASKLLLLALLVGCAMLAAMAGLFVSGWNNEIDPLDPAQARPLPDMNLAQVDPFDIGDVDDYREIGERPLFENNRRPKPPAIVDTGGEDDDDTPPAELDVAIGGIIITADKKIALLTNNATKKHMRVREGANLEDELADWVLTSIEPRKLSFDGGPASGTVELELKVSNKAIKAPVAKPVATKPAATSTEFANGARPKPESDRAARAEEIRRRVAERREKLREEAARRRAEREQQEDDDDQ